MQLFGLDPGWVLCDLTTLKFMQYRFNPLIQLWDEGAWQLLRLQMMQPDAAKNVSNIKSVSNIKKNDHNCRQGVTSVTWMCHSPSFRNRGDRLFLEVSGDSRHDRYPLIRQDTLRSLGKWQQTAQEWQERGQKAWQKIVASTLRLFCLFRRLFIQLRWQQESGA